MASSLTVRGRLLGPLAALAAAVLPGTVRSSTLACSDGQPLPHRFRLEYEVVAARGPLAITGVNELVWQRDGDAYVLTSTTRSSLYRAQQMSRGAFSDGVLMPSEYRERNPRRDPATAQIDWSGQTVSFSGSEDTQRTEPRMQDRLSMLVQIGQTLRLKPDLPTIEFPVVGSRGVSRYRFERRGAESVDIPAGRYQTLKLERPRDNRHDGLEIWYAPALCWLPVRMRFVDDRGQSVTNDLREVHGEAVPAPAAPER